MTCGLRDLVWRQDAHLVRAYRKRATLGQAREDCAEVSVDKMEVKMPPLLLLQSGFEDRMKQDEKQHFENGVYGIHLRHTFTEEEMSLRKRTSLTHI